MNLKLPLVAALAALICHAQAQTPGYYPPQPSPTPAKHLWNLFQRKPATPQPTPYTPPPAPTMTPEPKAKSSDSSGSSKPAKKSEKDMYNMSPSEKSSKPAKPKKDVAETPEEKVEQSRDKVEQPRDYVGDSLAPESVPVAGENGKVIVNWPTGHNLIALTFDDGPHPTITPKLIAVLKEKDVKATFYLLGEQIKEFPKIAEQLSKEGFELGNHTYDHKQLNKMSAEQIESELSRTHDLITSASGSAPKTMRPPYGEYRAKDHRVADACEKMGYPIILWDVDTNDWKTGKGAQPEDAMIKNILKNSHDGSIILMHDRYQKSVNATAAVIDTLRKEGFEFVTISELLSYPRAVPVHTSTSTEPTSAPAKKKIVLPQ